MEILDVGRGSHKEVSGKTDVYVSIDKWTPPGAGSLVIGFRNQFREKHSTTQCFNEVNHVYAFGHDPENSPFSIEYLVFIGEECMSRMDFKPSKDLADFVRAYLEYRLSHYKKVVKLTYRGAMYVRGIITGFDVSVYDPEMHICSVTLSGKCM